MAFVREVESMGLEFDESKDYEGMGYMLEFAFH